VCISINANFYQHGSQGPSLSLEDGAVLGRLFSKLSSEDQIPGFLNAFQDLRASRCSAISASELEELVCMTLPPGTKQTRRDMVLRQQDAAGQNILTPDENDVSSAALARWDQIKFLFGYDCEDEADNWWVQWGLLAMRAKGVDLRMGMPIDCKCQTLLH
jgi:salicylate hydroxylase